MNINTYLNYLTEQDLKSLTNIPKEKIELKVKNLISILKSKNINKLKSLANSNPQIEFNKIEKFSKSNINGFNSLYSFFKKNLSSKLKGDSKKVLNEISAIFALSSSINEQPIKKAKEYLNNFSKKNIKDLVSDVSKFIFGFLLTYQLTNLYHSVFIINISNWAPLAVLLIFLILMHLIYKYL